MEIKRVKIEVEFGEISCFEPFIHEDIVYLKLPLFICTVSEFVSPVRSREVSADFTAVRLNEIIAHAYKKFANREKVRPLKAELKIYE